MIRASTTSSIPASLMVVRIGGGACGKGCGIGGWRIRRSGGVWLRVCD